MSEKLTQEQKDKFADFVKRINTLYADISAYSDECEDKDRSYEAIVPLQDAMAMLEEAAAYLDIDDDEENSDDEEE